MVLVPLIVFSASPRTPEWWREGRLLTAIAVCYLLINLAVNLKWDVIHAAVNAMPNPTEADLNWATADGANYVFARVFGWVSAATYVGWWELMWRLLNRKIIAGHKMKMQLSSRIIGFSLIVSLLVALYSISFGYPRGIRVFFHMILHPWLDIFYR